MTGVQTCALPIGPKFLKGPLVDVVKQTAIPTIVGDPELKRGGLELRELGVDELPDLNWFFNARKFVAEQQTLEWQGKSFKDYSKIKKQMDDYPTEANTPAGKRAKYDILLNDPMTTPSERSMLTELAQTKDLLTESGGYETTFLDSMMESVGVAIENRYAAVDYQEIGYNTTADADAALQNMYKATPGETVGGVQQGSEWNKVSRNLSVLGDQQDSGVTVMRGSGFEDPGVYVEQKSDYEIEYDKRAALKEAMEMQKSVQEEVYGSPSSRRRS